MPRKHAVLLNEKEYQVLIGYAQKLGITQSEAMRRLIQQLLEKQEH